MYNTLFNVPNEANPFVGVLDDAVDEARVEVHVPSVAGNLLRTGPIVACN